MMNPVQCAFATVGRITEALFPPRNWQIPANPMPDPQAWLNGVEEQSEVLEPRMSGMRVVVTNSVPIDGGMAIDSSVFESDFPGCNCTGAQAADLADHRPACAARAAGDSPEAVSSPPTLPASGRPNLKFPDPAEMAIWPDWLVMQHAANLITFTPETRQTVDELRIRAFALRQHDTQ